MKDTLSILFIVLVIWLILYIILEVTILKRKIKDIDIVFSELDILFIKRLNVLYKMLDIIKEYNKIEFEVLSSDLYDYINEYDEYNLEKRIIINENLELNIKKILLVSKAYPELLSNIKYVKYEKQLVRFNKVINKLCKKYNNAILAYMDRQKVFPSSLLCKFLKKERYRYFSVKN